MQLVQLSDIHVGSFFKQQVFDTVVEEINKLARCDHNYR
jgi:hypothetical protein